MVKSPQIPMAIKISCKWITLMQPLIKEPQKNLKNYNKSIKRMSIHSLIITINQLKSSKLNNIQVIKMPKKTLIKLRFKRIIRNRRKMKQQRKRLKNKKSKDLNVRWLIKKNKRKVQKPIRNLEKNRIKNRKSRKFQKQINRNNFNNRNSKNNQS